MEGAKNDKRDVNKSLNGGNQGKRLSWMDWGIFLGRAGAD